MNVDGSAALTELLEGLGRHIHLSLGRKGRKLKRKTKRKNRHKSFPLNVFGPFLTNLVKLPSVAFKADFKADITQYPYGKTGWG